MISHEELEHIASTAFKLGLIHGRERRDLDDIEAVIRALVLPADFPSRLRGRMFAIYGVGFNCGEYLRLKPKG